MVPPSSIRMSRVPTYSSLPNNARFKIQGYHLLWQSFPAYSSTHALSFVTGLFRFRSPLLTESRLISFPLGTEMFHFPRYTRHINCAAIEVHSMRFPYSEIFGSKIARHLPEAYRRHAASFIAILSLGIHRTLLLSY